MGGGYAPHRADFRSREPCHDIRKSHPRSILQPSSEKRIHVPCVWILKQASRRSFGYFFFSGVSGGAGFKRLVRVLAGKLFCRPASGKFRGYNFLCHHPSLGVSPLSPENDRIGCPVSKALVLLSGGLDSGVLLWRLKVMKFKLAT